MSHAVLLGTLSLVTDGEVTEGAGRARGWIPSGKQGNAAKLSISNPAGGEAPSSASVPMGREAACAGVGAEHPKPPLEAQGRCPRNPGNVCPCPGLLMEGVSFFSHFLLFWQRWSQVAQLSNNCLCTAAHTAHGK